MIYHRHHTICTFSPLFPSGCHSYFLYSEVVDAATILEQIELQIAKVKEEAFSRKEILEKVEKWLAACEEEAWLEEYNRVKVLLCAISSEVLFFF